MEKIMPDAPAAAPADDVKTTQDDSFDLGEAMLEESPSPTESSTEENQETTPAEERKAPEEEGEKPKETEEDKPKEGEESEETKEGDEDSKPKDSAEERKAKLNNEIRQLVSTKNQLRTEVAQMNEEKYRTQSEEELVANGMDPAEARVEAAEQKQKLAEYNSQVADLNSALEVETLQVFADHPVFDPESSEFNPAIEKLAREAYTKAAGIQRDENTGLVNQVNVLPYEIYTAFADAYSLGTKQGEVSGQKATEKMMAAAEPRSVTAPKSTDEEDDPFMKGFNSVK